jgi:chromosomal replication initiator protein
VLVDNKGLSLNVILNDVSHKTNIPVELMKLKSRGRPIVEARQIYFKRAKEITKCSLAAIGLLVNRDHSTVIHGICTVNNVRELSKRYDEYFNNIN